MTPTRRDLRPETFLPLSPQDFEVLVQLADRPLHGYAIVQAAQESGQVKVLELGSLYRIIARMEENRLIEEVTAPAGSDTDGRTRRYYRATALGRSVARAEAARLGALLASPRVLRLAEGGGKR